MSDTNVHPPLRLKVLQASTITRKDARRRLDAFLTEYASRPGSGELGGGGDSTIRVRLEKMSRALKDEAKRDKTRD